LSESLLFRDKYVDYHLESICEAEPKSFEIAGQKPEACEVSVEILGFRRMIRCEAGRPLAYFVGIEGIILAMFLPEVLKNRFPYHYEEYN
jgi:hypothetical protein